MEMRGPFLVRDLTFLKMTSGLLKAEGFRL